MTLNPIVNEPSFRTCPACGTPTPGENPRCEHCGAGSVESVFEAQKAASERRFLHALFTRSNPFTMIFIGANVGIFVLMSLAGGISAASADHSVLIGFGAKQNALIAEQQQYWRVVTSIFIHIGLIHLLLNNYALWIIGQEIERIYGSARFVVLYLATGVLGSVGSYLFSPQATSAGASGAIFGLFGVMATFAFRYRREIPELLSREIKRRVLPIIAINLLFGFSVSVVDNAAHIGGLVSGIVLALLIPYKRPSERRTPQAWRALQVVCIAIIFVSFVFAFRSYNGPDLRLDNLTRRPGSNLKNYVNNIQEADRALSESINSFGEVLDNRTATDAGAAIESVERGIRAVNSTPRINGDADHYRNRLIELLTDQRTLLDQYSRSRSKDWNDFEQKRKLLIDRYNRFLSEYGKWLPVFVEEYGYRLSESGDQ